MVDWLLIKERFLYARSRPTFYFSGINSLSINLLKIIDLSIKVHFCMPSRAQNSISGLLFINFLKVIDWSLMKVQFFTGSVIVIVSFWFKKRFSSTTFNSLIHEHSWINADEQLLCRHHNFHTVNIRHTDNESFEVPPFLPPTNLLKCYLVDSEVKRTEVWILTKLDWNNLFRSAARAFDSEMERSEVWILTKVAGTKTLLFT